MLEDEMVKYVLGLMLAVAGVSGAGAAGQEKTWHLVRGNALQVLFADQDLGDGVHYAYQFHRGGSLTGMNMGKATQGTWRVAGQYLCYTWNRSKSAEECYEVRQQGHEVQMFLDGYEAFSGTLTPIQRPVGEATAP
jgi:hypothetical protein